MEQQNAVAQESQPRYPMLTDRVQSTFIDTIFILILMFGLAKLLDHVSDPPDWTRIAIFLLLFGIYEPVCVAYGCTLGNYIKGIRVRRERLRTKRINLFQAFVRYVLKLGLGWISFVTIHLNDDRQAIHDLAAGSVVIMYRTCNKTIFPNNRLIDLILDVALCLSYLPRSNSLQTRS